ncbi:sigma-70 family RNA polymerase sigma factor [Embleya sp. AB8]|uniref:RNA polymerase sigma factor n=1 Tax=Embleya sp. AB8 TaxID=3156304 RepID=UPI003C70C676
MSESPERVDAHWYDPTDAEIRALGLERLDVFQTLDEATDFDDLADLADLDVFAEVDPQDPVATAPGASGIASRPHTSDPARQPQTPGGIRAIDLTRYLPDDYHTFARTHLPTLTRLAYRSLGSVADAVQAVEDVMVVVDRDWAELLRAPGPPIDAVVKLLMEHLDDHAAQCARVRHAVAPHRNADDGPRLPVELPWADEFVEFARAYRPTLTSLARRRLGPLRQDAEDVVSEVMLAMCVRWNLLVQHPSPPQALAYRMLKHKAVDWQRRAVHRREISVDFTAPSAPEVVSARAASADPATFVPELHTVHRAISLMPPKRGACAWLHLVMQVPPAEVAAYLGITISTVRSHVHAARRELAAAQRGTVPYDPVRPHPPEGKTT